MPPTFEEIIAALASDTPEGLRTQLLDRIRASQPSDEAVAGARAFLEDNGYEWQQLAAFLSPPAAGIPTEMPPRSRLRQALAAAAAAAVLMGILWGLARPSRHELVSAAMFHEPGPPVFAGVAGEKHFNELISAFRQGQPDQGLHHLRILERGATDDDDTLSYFGGWLYYMRQDYDSAADRFGRICAVPSASYRRKAELLQAAALCLGRRLDTARSLLRHIIIDSGHPYRSEAVAILSDDRLW